MIPGIIGFAVSFIIQFRLKNHIDREKVLQLENLAELYPKGLPPRKFLTAHGRKLYGWFYAGSGLFMISMTLTFLLYRRH